MCRIESHTAYLPGGYADRPSEIGMRLFPPDEYKTPVLTLNQHGFQVYTHAIGDGAIELGLDAYQEAQAVTLATGAANPRNRIEHAEGPDTEDIPRFGKLGVIASMQPLMIYPRDEWVPEQGIAVAEALQAYTLDSAYASRADDQEGSIVIGKLADVVAFSHHFLEPPAAKIADAHVLTIVGGKVVYELQ